MKARVRATGNIVDVEWYGHNSMGTIYADVTHTATYYEYELDFDTVYDYWTRLEHTYAGMAMQGILSNEDMQKELMRIFGKEEAIEDTIVDYAKDMAQLLVKKMKEERK